MLWHLIRRLTTNGKPREAGQAPKKDFGAGRPAPQRGAPAYTSFRRAGSPEGEAWRASVLPKR